MTSTPSPRLFRPLFRLDPGWPFVLAGLALLIAGVLIPAQRELHELRNEARRVDADEARVYAHLQAYDRFLGDLKAGQPDLVRRLAMAQLNMVPKGEQSLLLTPGLNQTVAQWINESVPSPQVAPAPYPDTLLARLALGPNRLWMLAGSVFLLFVGLLLGPDNGRSAAAVLTEPEPKDDAFPNTRVTDAAGSNATRSDVTGSDATTRADTRAPESAPESAPQSGDEPSPFDARRSLHALPYIDVEVVGDAEVVGEDVEVVAAELDTRDDETLFDAAVEAQTPPCATVSTEDRPSLDDADGLHAPQALDEFASAFDDQVIALDTDRTVPGAHGAD